MNFDAESARLKCIISQFCYIFGSFQRASRVPDITDSDLLEIFAQLLCPMKKIFAQKFHQVVTKIRVIKV